MFARTGRINYKPQCRGLKTVTRPEIEWQARDLVQKTLQQAKEQFPGRIIAAYCLGSLAHGGFSPVSDVDFGLVLTHPLNDEDVTSIGLVKSKIEATNAPFSGNKLSIFWGSLDTLQRSVPFPILTNPSLGRFPAPDVLDLIHFGELLEGRDIRTHIHRPTTEEVIVACTQFAIGKLGNDYLPTVLKTAPHFFETQQARPITKCILWPIRMMYTGQTGLVGANNVAVDRFISRTQDRKAAELVMKGLEWRFGLPDFDQKNVQLFQETVPRLYKEYVHQYSELLNSYSRKELAEILEESILRGFQDLEGPWV